VFLGTHAPRLDDKGRLFLPAKFREELAAGVVLTKSQERAVAIWPRAEFDTYAARLNEASRSNANARSYLRVFFSGAFDQLPDRQGRITVPGPLREYAGLDRDVIVTGNGTTCELWDAAAWADYERSHEGSFAELSEEVVPGLF